MIAKSNVENLLAEIEGVEEEPECIDDAILLGNDY
jgi:hypothetical protein